MITSIIYYMWVCNQSFLTSTAIWLNRQLYEFKLAYYEYRYVEGRVLIKWQTTIPAKVKHALSSRSHERPMMNLSLNYTLPVLCGQQGMERPMSDSRISRSVWVKGRLYQNYGERSVITCFKWLCISTLPRLWILANWLKQSYWRE